MTCAAAVQSDTIWLQLKDYDVLPLNAKLSARIPELSNALRRGVAACADDSRENFFDVELKEGFAYIHVHDPARTAYLVAYRPN